MIENPAIADWFFTHRVQQFIDAYYIGVLGATNYWLRLSGNTVVALMHMV